MSKGDDTQDLRRDVQALAGRVGCLEPTVRRLKDALMRVCSHQTKEYQKGYKYLGQWVINWRCLACGQGDMEYISDMPRDTVVSLISLNYLPTEALPCEGKDEVPTQ